MPAQLVVIAGPDNGRVFTLSVGGVCAIGRGAQSQTQLADGTVSRIHCEVRLDGKGAVVSDAKSASGTFVNGMRIEHQELQAGDVIQIGDTRLRLDLEAEAPPVKEVVFANKAGARVLPRALRELHELAGKSLGSYQLLSVVGTGQIGVVFKAKDTKDQKTLALKVLRSDFAKDKNAMRRFVRGMMTVRTLSHANLIELYNAGITGSHCWIAMEFIEGNNLAEIIRQAAGAKQRDWKQALAVAVHMSRALGFVHEHGMIHRNVMPPNIIVQKSDHTAKLGDAMLAKALEGNAADAVTATGEFVGNVYFMAPERTVAGSDIDGRADQFSLGITIYTLLTGRMPFEGTSLTEVITKIRRAEPEKPRMLQPAIPDDFEIIVLKMMAKRPEGRYPTAGEMRNDLERVAKNHGVKI